MSCEPDTNAWPPRPDIFNKIKWGGLPDERQYLQAFRAWHLPDQNLQLDESVSSPRDDEEFSLDDAAAQGLTEALVFRVLQRIRVHMAKSPAGFCEKPTADAQARHDSDAGGWRAREFIVDMPMHGSAEEACFDGRRIMDPHSFTVKQLRAALGPDAVLPKRPLKLDLQRALAERESAVKAPHLSILPRADLSDCGLDRADSHRIPFRLEAPYSAYELYTWAVHASPYNPAYWVSRAYLFYQQGHYDLALGDAYRAMVLTETVLDPQQGSRRPGLYARVWDAVLQHLLLQAKTDGYGHIWEALHDDQNVLLFLPPVRLTYHHIIALSLLACEAIADFELLDHYFIQRQLLKHDDRVRFLDRLNTASSIPEQPYGILSRYQMPRTRTGFMRGKVLAVEPKLDPAATVERLNAAYFGGATTAAAPTDPSPAAVPAAAVALNIDRRSWRVVARHDLEPGDVIHTELPFLRGYFQFAPVPPKPSAEPSRAQANSDNWHLARCENCKRKLTLSHTADRERQLDKLEAGGLQTDGLRDVCPCLLRLPAMHFCPAPAGEAVARAAPAQPRLRLHLRAGAGRKRAADEAAEAAPRQPKRRRGRKAAPKKAVPPASPRRAPVEDGADSGPGGEAGEAKASCLEQARQTFHFHACGKDWSWLHRAMQSTVPWHCDMDAEEAEKLVNNRKHRTELGLLLREVFDRTLHAREAEDGSKRGLMPHELEPLHHLAGGDDERAQVYPFGWIANIVLPFDILETFGVDIFRDLAFDTWSIQIVLRKLLRNFTPWWKTDHPYAVPPATSPQVDDAHLYPGIANFRTTCRYLANARLKHRRDGEANNEACVVCSHPIRAGEEIVVQKVDADSNILAAQAHLRGRCSCIQCQVEPDDEPPSSPSALADPMNLVGVRTESPGPESPSPESLSPQ